MVIVSCGCNSPPKRGSTVLAVSAAPLRCSNRVCAPSPAITLLAVLYLPAYETKELHTDFAPSTSRKLKRHRVMRTPWRLVLRSYTDTMPALAPAGTVLLNKFTSASILTAALLPAVASRLSRPALPTCFFCSVSCSCLHSCAVMPYSTFLPCNSSGSCCSALLVLNRAFTCPIFSSRVPRCLRTRSIELAIGLEKVLSRPRLCLLHPVLFRRHTGAQCFCQSPKLFKPPLIPRVSLVLLATRVMTSGCTASPVTCSVAPSRCLDSWFFLRKTANCTVEIPACTTQSATYWCSIHLPCPETCWKKACALLSYHMNHLFSKKGVNAKYTRTSPSCSL